MSHIIYRGKGYRLENNIEAKQLDYDRFDHLVCYAYNLVGDMPDTVLEILRQVNYKAYAEQNWNLFNLINVTKERYEKARWEFREDFNKAVDRLVAAKCRDYNKSIQPLASAATQAQQLEKVEEKVVSENEAHLAEALKHIGKPEPKNKRNGPVFKVTPKGHVLGE